MKLVAKLIIAAVIFFGGFYVGQQQSVLSDQSTVRSSDQSVNLMIDFGDDEIKTYRNITGADTVFNLLKNITSENDLEFSYQDYGGEMGVFIESIGDVKNDPGQSRYWQYWVNGEYSKIGASGYRLQTGDTVVWKYLINQF